MVDTNLVLSALVFGAGTPGPASCLAARSFAALVSNPTAAELLRALAYPKFQLSPAERGELLADYLPCCETVGIPEPPPAAPPLP